MRSCMIILYLVPKGCTKVIFKCEMLVLRNLFHYFPFASILENKRNTGQLSSLAGSRGDATLLGLDCCKIRTPPIER